MKGERGEEGRGGDGEKKNPETGDVWMYGMLLVIE